MWRISRCASHRSSLVSLLRMLKGNSVTASHSYFHAHRIGSEVSSQKTDHVLKTLTKTLLVDRYKGVLFRRVCIKGGQNHRSKAEVT